MSKLNLIVHTQGVKGGETKATKVGYTLLEMRVAGHEVARISVDTFQGQGATYQEREEPQICFTFKGKSYTMNAGLLETILVNHSNKIK